MKENKKERSDPLALFSSVKLAVILLILIAIASVFGTLLPQQEKAAALASGLSPAVQKIWVFMGLSNLYHSWWFRLLLAALAFNLTACTLDRFPSALRLYRARLKPDMDKPFEGLPEDRIISVGAKPAESARIVSEILSKRYPGNMHKETGGVHFFAAEKGRFSLFGVHTVHASVLLILAGALVGSFFGFQAYVNIPEGAAVDTVYLRSTREPLPLGFTVRCNSFHVEFYETGTPKEYRSELVFVSGDSKPETTTIRVNHPAAFNGVTFYQSSYGLMPGGTVRFRIREADNPEIDMHIEARPGTRVDIPGDRGHFHITDMHNNFMNAGAAVLLTLHRAEMPEAQFWVFENPDVARSRLPGPMAMSRRFDPSASAPLAFEFVDISRRYYTGLQANKDPGVPLVWAGFILMTVGFVVTFFYSHRRIRVMLKPEKDGTMIKVAGWSNRNPVGLEQETDTIMSEIAESLSGGLATSGDSNGKRRKVRK